MTTADRIKNRRIELGLTQMEVAKRLGLTSKAAVCKVEKQGNNVTLKNVEKFAEALDCSIPYLMGYDEENFQEQLMKFKEEINAKGLSEEEVKFVDLYSQLNDEQKKLIDNMLSALTSKL